MLAVTNSCYGVMVLPGEMEKLAETKATLLKIRADIDRQLKLIDELEIARRKLEAESIISAFPDIAAPSEKEGQRSRNVLSPETLAHHARAVILEKGSPLKRGALLKEFDARGIPVVGGDRAKVLGTIIWRAKNRDGSASFQNTPGGYWPSDVPLPPSSRS